MLIMVFALVASFSIHLYIVMVFPEEPELTQTNEKLNIRNTRISSDGLRLKGMSTSLREQHGC